MGLGKTLALISLILQRKNERLNGEFIKEDEHIRKQSLLGNHLIKSHASLIVAPASVIMQWDKEIRERVSGRLRHIVCHGPTRERFADRSILCQFLIFFI
jgi:SNF2 family DNA or RNA helicase